MPFMAVFLNTSNITYAAYLSVGIGRPPVLYTFSEGIYSILLLVWWEGNDC